MVLENKRIFDYLGVTDAHKNSIIGTNSRCVYWDLDFQNGYKHAKAVQDTINQVSPTSKIMYVRFNGDVEEQLKKIIDLQPDVVNISMIGIDLELALNGVKAFPSFNVLRQRALIIASNGNSGKNEMLKPSCLDSVIGVTACHDVGFGTYKPKFSSYSTTNEQTKFCMPSNIKLTYEEQLFSGTSASAPVLTGCYNLFVNAFYKKFAKKPDVYEGLAFLMACAQDIEEEGHDNKTGYGIVRLDFDKMVDYVYVTSRNEYVNINQWRKEVLENYKK